MPTTQAAPHTDPMDRDTPEWVRETNPLTLSEEEYRRWLAESRRGVGGSDAAALIGANQWRTPANVYDRILRLDETPTNANMERGLALEAHAIEVYRQRTQREVTDGDFIRGPEDKPWQVGHPDGYIEKAEQHNGRGILEIKCPRLAGFYRVRTEGIDPSYYCQVQWYMGITGLEWASFGIFSGEEWDIYWFDVTFDAELFEQMDAAAAAFWEQHILTRQRPHPIQPLLSATVPRVGNESVELVRPDHIEALDEFVAAKRAEKEAKERVKAAETRIKEIVDEVDAERVHRGDIRITYRQQDGAEYLDVESLLRDHPEIDPTPYRRRRRPSRPLRVYGI